MVWYRVDDRGDVDGDVDVDVDVDGNVEHVGGEALLSPPNPKPNPNPNSNAGDHSWGEPFHPFLVRHDTLGVSNPNPGLFIHYTYATIHSVRGGVCGRVCLTLTVC